MGIGLSEGNNIQEKLKSKNKTVRDRNWARWLLERGIGLDQVDDHCSDKEFRTARSNDQNVAIGAKGGKVYPVSTKRRRKPKCSRGLV